MFTGIVECTSTAVTVDSADKSILLRLKRPTHFTDLAIGHSVAVNGVCLTLENFDSETMSFCIGTETLQVVGWSAAELAPATLNLERAMLVGSRLHGHWVTGHVDGLGHVLERHWDGECLIMSIRLPENVRPFVWSKGSVTLNGVSLTVNKVVGCEREIEVCLIPETLRRTNLSSLESGQSVTVEGDYLAKAIQNLRAAEVGL